MCKVSNSVNNYIKTLCTTYRDFMNFPKRKGTRMPINKVPQVPRVRLQSFERRSVERVKNVEFDIGQHYSKRIGCRNPSAVPVGSSRFWKPYVDPFLPRSHLNRSWEWSTRICSATGINADGSEGKKTSNYENKLLRPKP